MYSIQGGYECIGKETNVSVTNNSPVCCRIFPTNLASQNNALQYINVNGSIGKYVCMDCGQSSLSTSIDYRNIQICKPFLNGAIQSGKIICNSNFQEFNNQCVPDTLNDLIRVFNIDAVRQVTFRFQADNSNIFTVDPSAIIELNFNKIFIACNNERDEQSCQMIANLCVLTLYRFEGDICKLYSELYKRSITNSTKSAVEYVNNHK